jgi:ribose transport system substrate-binding protein
VSKKALFSLSLSAIVALSALIVPGAVPKAQAAKQYKIVLIAGIASDAFYITMNHGAQAEAKVEGATVQFSGSPAAFSPETQLPFLNAAIAQKPDLILIAPTDKVAMQAPIQRAVSAHIPVILVDTTLNDPSLAVTTISSDNVSGGEKVADALATAIDKKGTVAVISVTPGISTTDQRVEGFNKQLKNYPDVKSLGVTFTGDNQTRANTVLKSLVTAHKDLAGVFATNVVTGPGMCLNVQSITSTSLFEIQILKLLLKSEIPFFIPHSFFPTETLNLLLTFSSPSTLFLIVTMPNKAVAKRKMCQVQT